MKRRNVVTVMASVGDIPFSIVVDAGGHIATVAADGLRHINKSNVRTRGRGRSPLWRAAKDYERAIAYAARSSYEREPVTCALVVSISIELGNVYSARGRVTKGETRAKRNDVDGVKSILDALNGIVYKDDSQIESLAVRMRSRTDGEDGDRVVVSVFHAERKGHE